MPPASFHTQLLFVRPVTSLAFCGSCDFSQGACSTYHRSGVFKSDSKAWGETHQVTSTPPSPSMGGKLTDGWQLWDTAGQERFRYVPLTRYPTLRPNLLSIPDLLLAVIIEGLPGQSWYTTSRGTRDSEDNTNRLTLPPSRASFLNLSRWLADARALGSPNLVVVLVGNKSDREDDREVEWTEASKWAAENGVSLKLYPPPFCYRKFIVLVQTYTSWKPLRYQVIMSRLHFSSVLGQFC